MNKDAVKKIVDSIYPKVQQFYGLSKFNSKTPKVKYHHNIYARITGIAEAEGECSPAAEFERETNTIWIYYPEATNKEWVIQTLIHEYIHYLQSPLWMKRYYDMGYEYDTHPYELAATKAEDNWKTFA
jgi:hypothetical protein|tara:strand:- start:1229 stop:1612 length:384 start_codon:yes stop_codon:yes gene_type:complete